SAGDDKSVVLWDLARGEHQATFNQTDRIVALAVSGDGETLAVGLAPPAVQLWDLKARRKRGALRADQSVYGVDFLVFSPTDPKLLVAGDHGAYKSGITLLWDVAGEKELTRITHAGESDARPLFSPDGKYLVNPFSRGDVSVWEL